MDPRQRRQALRLLSNGVYVLTSRCDGRLGAATVTWVSQASFAPPLLMAAVRPESHVYRCLRDGGTAALHIVARGQESMARKFFAPTDAGPSVVNGEPWREGVTTAPILDGAPAYLECRVRRILDDLGDHALVVLEVVEASCRGPVEPMTIAESPWEYGG